MNRLIAATAAALLAATLLTACGDTTEDDCTTDALALTAATRPIAGAPNRGSRGGSKSHSSTPNRRDSSGPGRRGHRGSDAQKPGKPHHGHGGGVHVDVDIDCED
jgi:hypothetical protein